jgi:hypothetical protein
VLSLPGPDQNAEPAAVAPPRGQQRLLAHEGTWAGVLAPWLSLAVLWLLFELPRVFSATTPDLTAIQFSLEVPLLFTLAGLATLTLEATALGVRVRRLARAALRWTVWGLATGLLALRADQWICWLLMREEPLLYDQWFMAKHLGVLLGDLISPASVLILLGVTCLGWLLARLTRRLLRSARPLLEPVRRRQTVGIALALWALALICPAQAPPGTQARVGFLTPALLDNLHRSRAVYERVQKTSESSPHARLSTLTLHDKPDVLLFIVESYGRLLSVDAEARDTHLSLLRTLTDELEGAGWHAASAFSTSTVSGGRSWIAEGTMLMGLPIKYESVFQHLVALRPQPPSLVSFLRGQGYYTSLLAPADRNRPGA